MSELREAARRALVERPGEGRAGAAPTGAEEGRAGAAPTGVEEGRAGAAPTGAEAGRAGAAPTGVEEAREPARVERVIFEVVAEGRSELVTLALREGRLLCVTSDGREDGPHVRAALRLLAGAEPLAAPSVRPEPRSAPPVDRPDERRPSAIPALIEDVLTAIARVGVLEAVGAPSVTDALERLLGAVPRPAPLGLARWVGRLREALARRDTDLVARLLEGAARTAADLRGTATSPEARMRLRAWWGPDAVPGALAPADLIAGEGVALHERRLVEVGREHLAGLARADIERRYLVDLESGAVYREDRRQGAPASIGPCPRTLKVGLGDAQSGAPPAALRLLQYEVTPEVDAEAWLLLEGLAERDFAALAERYRKAQRSFPGQAEPFALVSPARCDFTGGMVLEDPKGHVLPLARDEDPGAAAVLDGLADGATPTWVAGRLVDSAGILLLVPVAAALGSGLSTAHLRLR